MTVESYVLRLQKEGPRSAGDRAVMAFLGGLEKLYLRGALRKYRKDTAGAVHAGIPVISAGNITAGGTGKTPCIMALAEMLQKKGRHPAILTRGYRGGAEKKGAVVSNRERVLLSPLEAGDEPYLMAVRLPGVPVIAGRDRVRSAREAEAMGADVLLLDDGFQYWKLSRDLDLVLVDCTNPFGGGHVLPRGLLREPLEHMNRAGVIILTKCDQVSRDALEGIERNLARLAPETPVISSSHHPSALTEISQWRKGEKDSLSRQAGKTVYLLSGLGNPDAFRRTAVSAGMVVRGEKVYPDHHRYSREEIEEAAARAKACGASCIMTTEKDAVKMDGSLPGDMPILVLAIEMTFSEEGKACIEKAMEDIL